MPAQRKSDPQRSRDRRKADLEIVPDASGVPAVTPSAPPEWSKKILGEWVEFWSSGLAETVQATDRPVIERLFGLRNLQAKALRRWERKPYIEGSQGQPVQNPAFAESMTLERQVVALEDRLGLSLKAKANLGIAMGQAKLTAVELNRMALEDNDVSDDDVIEVEGWEEAN